MPCLRRALCACARACVSAVREIGVPMEQRADVWEVLSGAREARLLNPSFYATALKHLRLSPKLQQASHAKDIKKDVARTMQVVTQLTQPTEHIHAHEHIQPQRNIINAQQTPPPPRAC